MPVHCTNTLLNGILSSTVDIPVYDICFMCARDLASCTLSTTAFHASVSQQHINSYYTGTANHMIITPQNITGILAAFVKHHPSMMSDYIISITALLFKHDHAGD